MLFFLFHWWLWKWDQQRVCKHKCKQKDHFFFYTFLNFCLTHGLFPVNPDRKTFFFKFMSVCLSLCLYNCTCAYGYIPLGWSGSGSVIQDLSGSWCMKETNESMTRMDSSLSLLYHDPDRSWITDPDPDHPKGTHRTVHVCRSLHVCLCLCVRLHVHVRLRPCLSLCLHLGLCVHVHDLHVHVYV